MKNINVWFGILMCSLKLPCKESRFLFMFFPSLGFMIPTSALAEAAAQN